MPAAATPHALEVTVQPTEGDADVKVFKHLSNENGESTPRIGESQEVGTGLDHIYIDSENAPPGANITIQVYPAEAAATFTMSIEVLEEGNGTISDRDAQVCRPSCLTRAHSAVRRAGGRVSLPCIGVGYTWVAQSSSSRGPPGKGTLGLLERMLASPSPEISVQ